jgi:hypothetical protein
MEKNTSEAKEKLAIDSHGVKFLVSCMFADAAFDASKNNVSSFIFKSLKASFVVSSEAKAREWKFVELIKKTS